MFIPFALLSLWSFTQSCIKGIYRTQADFDSHRLEFSAPASSRKVVIRTHEFLAAPYITVDSGGQKYYILKAELFGYSDGKRNFRFYGGQSYEIVDTAGFYLYAKSGLPKEKGSVVNTRYFFSKTGSDPILPYAATP